MTTETGLGMSVMKIEVRIVPTEQIRHERAQDREDEADSETNEVDQLEVHDRSDVHWDKARLACAGQVATSGVTVRMSLERSSRAGSPQ